MVAESQVGEVMQLRQCSVGKKESNGGRVPSGKGHATEAMLRRQNEPNVGRVPSRRGHAAEAMLRNHSFPTPLLAKKSFVFFYFTEIFVRVAESEASRRGGDGVSPSVSPSMEGVLPIRGVDVNTEEVMGITSVPREAEDLYKADVVRWTALVVPSIMVAEDLKLLREISSLCSRSPTNEPVIRGGVHYFTLERFYALPRCELSSEDVVLLWSIYEASPSTRRYGFILNRHNCLIELGLMASKHQERSPRSTLARLTKQRPKVLAPGSSEDLRQKKVLEDLSREGNRDEAEAPNVVEIQDTNASEVDVPLTRKKKNPEGSAGGPYDSRKKLRELIGVPSPRIPDDALQNVPFYLSMETQAVKKHFTPRWKEFTLYGDLEDILEVVLATAIRVSGMQLKVLGEFRVHMQEHKKFVAESSKSDKEHMQALEGLQATVDSMRMAYEHLQAELIKSESNVLNLTMQLDNANTAQKFAAEALEATNKEKNWLLGESNSHEQETQSLRESLKVAKKGRNEAEAEVARPLDEKNEMKAKMGNVEAKFVANFHNTKAYTNFSYYFARVGHQKVLNVLRTDHLSIDLGPLEAGFPPPDVEGEEDS
ncbi:Uncharacterized protein Adt_31059 [Abeliophyllum distichum]|uniref:Uncharacterized protein n=1 Tax=Abeliophyllum distichum TaxID=126358 RepID=A0ABD1RD10_9LAMI